MNAHEMHNVFYILKFIELYLEGIHEIQDAIVKGTTLMCGGKSISESLYGSIILPCMK